MNFAEAEGSKRYCIRTKHVAVICAVVVAVGLVVGLAVGLTRSCDSAGDCGQDTAPAPSLLPPAASLPPQDQDVCPASEDDSGQWTDFRLPDFLSPAHYDLEVRPLLEEDTYSGTVSISVNVSAPTRHLWLHLRETRITQLPLLRAPSGQQVPVKRCFEYKTQEYLVVEAEEELPPSGGDGLYVLTLEFAGWLNTSLVGFYRTTYTENGQTKSIAATDHEPTDARKSFPCFDEPNKKATYTISIIHPKEYKALSNMPVAKEEPEDDTWQRTTFEKSVPMSTYLVCFAVHQFQSVERTSNSGKPLTIYVQQEQKHTAEYAANITKIVFDYFEEYFAMDYSLPKLDQIAIPDFGTGAMENWGLITYRETNLLYDPEESASSNQQRVASVVAHELVHQWFGNTVTMDWWDDLWLNEGFASFFEFLGVDHAEKDWQMREQILHEDVLSVQEDDALMSSHPVVVTVTTPAEITSVFDGISYSKGASILRMLEDWLTPEKFQKGCQMYLEKFKFKNAKTSDFWEALEQASNLSVQEVMDTWTRQMGYPVLDVKDARNIVQKRFLLDSRADPSQPPSALGYTWNIPVKWTEDNISSITLYNRSEEGEYFQGQVKPIADSLAWTDTGDHLTKLLRASVLGLACKMGDREALSNASQLFEKWLSGNESVPVNLRLLVYRYGMQNSGNETSWNYTLEQYQKTPLAQEKDKLLYGLASVKSVTLLARFTINDRNLGRIVTIAEPFNTELQLWQMESFFAKYPEAGAGQTPREQVLETVKNNIEWLKQNTDAIREWFFDLPKNGS
uniref:Aminopeptidase n=1 Tax=Propithecus coquereli TaxID=379532 RepID=A0A2K6GBQ7_PROCO